MLHTHTRAGVAVSCLEGGLMHINQHSAMFYGRVAYHDYEGIALDLDERSRLVRDLGDKPTMILRNHGLLTAGRNVQEAFTLMYYLRARLPHSDRPDGDGRQGDPALRQCAAAHGAAIRQLHRAVRRSRMAGLAAPARRQGSELQELGSLRRFGGGAKPPNSRSINPANAIVVRSSRWPPMIWTPIGRPSSLRPIGATVAGRPQRVATAGQASWSP